MRFRILKAMTFWAKLQKPLIARRRMVQGHWAIEPCARETTQVNNYNNIQYKKYAINMSASSFPSKDES